MYKANTARQLGTQEKTVASCGWKKANVNKLDKLDTLETFEKMSLLFLSIYNMPYDTTVKSASQKKVHQAVGFQGIRAEAKQHDRKEWGKKDLARKWEGTVQDQELAHILEPGYGAHPESHNTASGSC